MYLPCLLRRWGENIFPNKVFGCWLKMRALQINRVLSTTRVSFFVDEDVDDCVFDCWHFEIGDDDITTSGSLFISQKLLNHNDDSYDGFTELEIIRLLCLGEYFLCGLIGIFLGMTHLIWLMVRDDSQWHQKGEGNNIWHRNGKTVMWQKNRHKNGITGNSCDIRGQ